jgi:hypothetical protein
MKAEIFRIKITAIGGTQMKINLLYNFKEFDFYSNRMSLKGLNLADKIVH